MALEISGVRRLDPIVGSGTAAGTLVPRELISRCGPLPECPPWAFARLSPDAQAGPSIEPPYEG